MTLEQSCIYTVLSLAIERFIHHSNIESFVIKHHVLALGQRFYGGIGMIDPDLANNVY